MPPVSRKRLRGAPANSLLPVASAPHAVQPTSDCASTGSTRVTEETLICLGQCIAAALESVASTAEASRARLRDVRSALHTALDVRCDELSASISAAEASKVALLERELVTVDTLLERWRSTSGAVREHASDVLVAHEDPAAPHTKLLSGLEDRETRLHAPSADVVEPPLVGLLADAPALLCSIAGFGRLLVPLPITASDVAWDGVPACVRLGGTLLLRLSLGTLHAAQCTEELEVSLEMLARSTRIEAMLHASGVEPWGLEASISPDAARRCLVISLVVPTSVPNQPSVTVSVVSVGGQLTSAGLRISIPVRRGILAPLSLTSDVRLADTNPCISLDGRLYCAPLGPDKVLVFDADGSPLPALSMRCLGLSMHTWGTAVGPADEPILVLADLYGAPSSLVAMSTGSGTVRWRTTSKGVFGYEGVVGLPALGIVVAAGKDVLCAHRISDGDEVGSIRVPGRSIFLASGDATGTIYGNVGYKYQFRVYAWSCTTDKAGVRFKPGRPIGAAGVSGSPRPLTVVPPVPGKTASLLVVASESSELLVLSLPGCAHVHTHLFGQEVQVGGLAADPWGEAIALCDDVTGDIQVLPWPLPGMPPLE